MTPPARRPLEDYRPLLRLLVSAVPKKLRPRFDESDVVHEALIKAHEKLAQCNAATEAQFQGWLRRILTTTLIDMIRRETNCAHDPGVEQQIRAQVGASSVRIGAILMDRGDRPDEAAQRREDALRVAQAIEQLRPEWREAIILHEIQGLPVREVAELMGKTEKAVAGLLRRGLEELGKLLPDYREGGPDGG